MFTTRHLMLSHAPLALTLALAACATTPPPRLVSAPAPVATVRVPGLERIVGRPAADAVALLGTASLDRHEGSGRALQFTSGGCILDVYYFADGAGPATARLAEARLPTGARDDPARCFAAQLAARGKG